MNDKRRRLDDDLVNRLTLDTEPWLSCDECFEQVDLYVEMLLRGHDDLPAMRAHLRGCPACLEEAVTLVLLAADDAGIDAGPLVERLGQR